ncbi:hypothetical protein H6F42_13455 [Pseudanabaena sp. FACHB-1998]|uniref:hypothetical protein n=1 Tax=Pseudanabaena sp. FACHB-1998 TaxID=2692858 RepID=UPI0016816CDD|nr:hypothetical protein [Pseudanabaena sp. FACHB-1998]MBD2177921.1 hypothetical protein [Pseudanabaena sp. FACHB-1998]
MLDLYCLGDSLGNFSRSHCVEICAFLVPANLIATSQTILFTVFKRSPIKIFTITAGAIVYALLMISHVISWYIVGVVMAPTFILMFLGIGCLAINCVAIWLKANHIEMDYLGILSKFFKKYSSSPNRFHKNYGNS